MIQVPQQVLLSVGQFWREFGVGILSCPIVSEAKKATNVKSLNLNAQVCPTAHCTAAAIILSVRGLVYFLSCYDLQPRGINGKSNGAGVDTLATVLIDIHPSLLGLPPGRTSA